MFKNLSFRRRLLLWIMPILVLGLFVLSFGTYLYVNNLIEKEFSRNMLTTTGKTADGINTWLKTLILEPETIASTTAAKVINTDFSQIDSQNINRHKILHENYPDIFQDIYAANKAGEYHTVHEENGVYSMFVGSVANRDYFKSIMAGGPAQITPPLVSRTTGVPTIFIVAPIKDEKDQPQGLVGAGISLSYIQVVAQGLKAYQTGYGVVLDKDGRLIYHPDKDLVMQKKLTEFEDQTVRELGDRMVAGGSGMFSYTYKGQKKMAFYQPIPVTGWSVATVVPEAELFAAAVRLLWVMAGITLLLTVIVCVIILIAASRLTKPLHELALHAHQIAAGNLNPGVLSVKHHDEVGTLTETFNLMTSNLHQAMEVLRNSENAFRSMVENISIGIGRSQIVPHSRYIQVNPAMVKILEYGSEEELLSVYVDELYKEPQEMSLFVGEIKKNGFVKDMELCFLKKNGATIWCSVTANADYDEHGEIKWINSFIEDITERKKLAEQLRQSQKMEAIGTLAGGVAHDFNNILTAIIGYSSLCKMLADKNSRISTYIDDILDASERATHLTQSLLAFSRKQMISLNQVDLNELVKKIDRFLVRIIGEDIDFKTDLCAENLCVLADAAQIEQVLMNLVTNARDAMPDGGIISINTERVDVLKATMNRDLKQGSYVVISISDNGFGMDEITRQRIFEPFFTTKEVGKGTGLGLSIVYGIVKQHNGDISVYSEPGSGTTFKIYLPLIDSKAEYADFAPMVQIVGGTETILVAEDDQTVRQLYREVLEARGYRIIEAADGEEAVARYLENHGSIQLLLFDVIMPKKNGKEAFDEIRKINSGIRAIFSSGYTADIISQKGLGDDSINLVSKPVHPAALAAKVREVLDAG